MALAPPGPCRYAGLVTLLVVVFLVVPLTELYVLVRVAHAIGLGAALAVLVSVSVLGGWMVKRQGTSVLRRIREQLALRQLPTSHLAEGGLVLLAGALLLVPGFVTDVFGALLLLPPVRKFVARLLLGRWTRGGRVIKTTYHGPIVDVSTRPQSAPPQELGPS